MGTVISCGDLVWVDRWIEDWFGNGYCDRCDHDNGSFGTSVFGWSCWERILGFFFFFFLNWKKKILEKENQNPLL